MVVAINQTFESKEQLDNFDTEKLFAQLFGTSEGKPNIPDVFRLSANFILRGANETVDLTFSSKSTD